MPSKKFYRNLNIILATGLIGYLGLGEESLVPRMAIYGTEEGLKQVHRKKAEEWLQEWYPEVLGDIERESGVMIQHLPQIEYQLPLDEEGKHRQGIEALYNPKNNTIYLDAENVMLPELRNMYLNYGCYGHCFELYSTLKHELGHAITEQIATQHKIKWATGDNTLATELKEKYGTSSKQNQNEQEAISILLSDPRVQQAILEKIISEGIAEYFENGPFEKRSNDSTSFPRDWDEYVRNGSYPYYFGRQLVTPIIQQYKADGITYLIVHPPLGISDFQGYQAQALSQLEANQKDKNQKSK